MKARGRWIKLAVISVVIITVLSTGVLAANNIINSGKGSGSSENAVSSDKNKNDIQVSETANKQKTSDNSSILSESKVIELYKKGYSIDEIEKAQEIAVQSDMKIEEVLNIKTGSGANASDEQKDVKKSNVGNKSKSWDDVKAEITLRKALEETGLPKDKIADMAEKQIQDNKKLSKDELLARKAEFESRQGDAIVLTKEDEETCKKNGVDDIKDIVKAKILSVKHKTALIEVLKLKKEKKTWDSVTKELGRGKR